MQPVSCVRCGRIGFDGRRCRHDQAVRGGNNDGRTHSGSVSNCLGGKEQGRSRANHRKIEAALRVQSRATEPRSMSSAGISTVRGG